MTAVTEILPHDPRPKWQLMRAHNGQIRTPGSAAASRSASVQNGGYLRTEPGPGLITHREQEWPGNAGLPAGSARCLGVSIAGVGRFCGSAQAS